MGVNGTVTTVDADKGCVTTTGPDGVAPRRYRIVDAIPEGYEIWVIGEFAPEGFVALCRPEEPGSPWADLGALCAIPSDHAREIMDASLYASTPEEARRLLDAGREGAVSGFRNIDEDNIDAALGIVRRALGPMCELFARRGRASSGRRDGGGGRHD